MGRRVVREEAGTKKVPRRRNKTAARIHPPAAVELEWIRFKEQGCDFVDEPGSSDTLPPARSMTIQLPIFRVVEGGLVEVASDTTRYPPLPSLTLTSDAPITVRVNFPDVTYIRGRGVGETYRYNSPAIDDYETGRICLDIANIRTREDIERFIKDYGMLTGDGRVTVDQVYRMAAVARSILGSVVGQKHPIDLNEVIKLCRMHQSKYRHPKDPLDCAFRELEALAEHGFKYQHKCERCVRFYTAPKNTSGRSGKRTQRFCADCRPFKKQWLREMQQRQVLRPMPFPDRPDPYLDGSAAETAIKATPSRPALCQAASASLHSPRSDRRSR
jgi:hypothetical protein